VLKVKKYESRDGHVDGGGSKTSNWWKDIINIRNGVDVGGECWFGDNIERKLENDESILLWKDEWVDKRRLFEVLVQ
jgi:hypothetical protein